MYHILLIKNLQLDPNCISITDKGGNSMYGIWLIILFYNGSNSRTNITIANVFVVFRIPYDTSDSKL
jgi:hypothetical protein